MIVKQAREALVLVQETAGVLRALWEWLQTTTSYKDFRAMVRRRDARVKKFHENNPRVSAVIVGIMAIAGFLGFLCVALCEMSLMVVLISFFGYLSQNSWLLAQVMGWFVVFMPVGWLLLWGAVEEWEEARRRWAK